MKREALKNISVIPCESGAVIDREGFLSAVFGVTVAAGGKVSVKISHSDTPDGTFKAVEDEHALLCKPESDVPKGGTDNFDIDLVGCKRYIKVEAEVTGEEASGLFAVALCDPAEAPV